MYSEYLFICQKPDILKNKAMDAMHSCCTSGCANNEEKEVDPSFIIHHQQSVSRFIFFIF